MRHNSTERIAWIKQRCIEFASNSKSSIPAARNTLVEEIFENPKLTNVLALTMDRLEINHGFGRYNRIKGCEEFIEFSNKKKAKGDRSRENAPSYELVKFSEELMILIEELKQ